MKKEEEEEESEEEEEEEEQVEDCCVCWADPSDCVFYKCGHMSLSLFSPPPPPHLPHLSL